MGLVSAASVGLLAELSDSEVDSSVARRRARKAARLPEGEALLVGVLWMARLAGDDLSALLPVGGSGDAALRHEVLAGPKCCGGDKASSKTGFEAFVGVLYVSDVVKSVLERSSEGRVIGIHWSGSGSSAEDIRLHLRDVCITLRGIQGGLLWTYRAANKAR